MSMAKVDSSSNHLPPMVVPMSHALDAVPLLGASPLALVLLTSAQGVNAKLIKHLLIPCNLRL